jgi:hypothetical protein
MKTESASHRSQRSAAKTCLGTAAVPKIEFDLNNVGPIEQVEGFGHQIQHDANSYT